MRTKGWELYDMKNDKILYGIKCFVNGKWMPTCRWDSTEKKYKPELFESDQEREAVRAELKKREA